MSYIESMFRKADVTGDEMLDLDELREFMISLFDDDDGKELSEEEVMEVSFLCRQCGFLFLFAWLWFCVRGLGCPRGRVAMFSYA